MCVNCVDASISERYYFLNKEKHFHQSRKRPIQKRNAFGQTDAKDMGNKFAKKLLKEIFKTCSKNCSTTQLDNLFDDNAEI